MSGPPALRQAYLLALSLPTGDITAPSTAARRAALARAHDLRKFEIENYWKRATYFWAFQIAAFTLLGLLWTKVVGEDADLAVNALLIPSGLGAITALVGALTARGSKFWQENWEAHVDALEADIEGRLTQVVFAKHGEQFSVSRVNENLLRLLTVGWVVLFVSIAFRFDASVPISWQPWLASGSLIAAVAYVGIPTRTKLHGMQLILGESGWRPLREASRRPWRLILRNTALAAAHAPEEDRVDRSASHE